MTDDITFGPTDDTSGGNGLFCIIGSNRTVSKKDPKELDLKTGSIKHFSRHLDLQLNMKETGHNAKILSLVTSALVHWAPLVLLQYWDD